MNDKMEPEPIPESEEISIPLGVELEKLAPSTIKMISEEKLKSFSLGSSKKSPFQKHKEMMEAKKKKAEEEAAAVYKDFVQSFEAESTKTSQTRTFKRGETIINNKVISESNDKKNYKMETKTSSSKAPPPTESPKKREDGRRKRALDELKEELKRGQEIREKSHKVMRTEDRSSRDSTDDTSNSSNLYITNLSSQVTEQLLWKEFGRFGAISSIKILWPRNDEEKRRSKNQGFVCFADRASALKAKDRMDGKEFFGLHINIGWGKSMNNHSSSKPGLLPTPGGAVTQSIQQVIVTIPSNPDLVTVINRLASFVASYGIQMEQKVKEKESSNPQFQFLFQNGTPDNNYYKWKVYSLLQGDSETMWRTHPVQMNVGGPFWVPPPLPPGAEDSDEKKPDLRGQFRDILKNVTMERSKIKSAMGFALDHADSAAQLVDILTESFATPDVDIPLKMARVYVVNDILYNSQAPVPNASKYRRVFEEKLPIIFKSLNETYRGLTGRITSQNFKEQILRVLRIWESWSVYSPELTQNLQTIFLANKDNDFKDDKQPVEEEEDIDGVPI